MPCTVRGGLARVWTDYGTVGTVQQLTPGHSSASPEGKQVQKDFTKD